MLLFVANINEQPAHRNPASEHILNGNSVHKTYKKVKTNLYWAMEQKKTKPSRARCKKKKGEEKYKRFDIEIDIHNQHCEFRSKRNTRWK